MRLDVDIGRGPRKNVFVFSTSEDEYALQRLNVLGSVCVSHDMRKQILHVIAVWKMDDCFDAQPGKDR